MKFDKLTMFFNKKTVTSEDPSNTTIESDVIDFRLCGDDICDNFKIFAAISDNDNTLVQSFAFQTSWDKNTWTDLYTRTATAAEADVVFRGNGAFYTGVIPSGVQRYLRMRVETFSQSDKPRSFTITAGLVDEIETPKVAKVQAFLPLEDLTEGA